MVHDPRFSGKDIALAKSFFAC